MRVDDPTDLSSRAAGAYWAQKAGEFRARLAKLVRGQSRDTMTITPEVAKVMMEMNTGNRPLNARQVSRYANAMAGGDWKLTGEPIIFSKEGILNDGQHRLAACIKAGVSFRTDVRFGVDRAAFDVTGVGSKRKVSDVLKINRHPQATRLAATLNWLHRYHRGLPGSCFEVLTTSQALEMLAENKGIEVSVNVGARLYTETRLITPSLGAALHFIFANKDQAMADLFFEFLLTGLGGSGKTDPRFVLRQRLIENASSKAKLPETNIAALAIKAWNAMRDGKAVKCLKWQTDPINGVEDFPVAR